jgi:hypothetical protein
LNLNPEKDFGPIAMEVGLAKHNTLVPLSINHMKWYK